MTRNTPITGLILLALLAASCAHAPVEALTDTATFAAQMRAGQFKDRQKIRLSGYVDTKYSASIRFELGDKSGRTQFGEDSAFDCVQIIRNRRYSPRWSGHYDISGIVRILPYWLNSFDINRHFTHAACHGSNNTYVVVERATRIRGD